MDAFDKLKQSWPSSLVSRREVGKFSGGLLHPRTLANLDSLGTGPERIRMGRLVAYPTDGLIEWMRSRSSTPDAFG